MSMEMVTLVLTVVIAHFFALISPGPDFLIIVKSAIRNDKSRAIGVALGIAPRSDPCSAELRSMWTRSRVHCWE